MDDVSVILQDYTQPVNIVSNSIKHSFWDVYISRVNLIGLVISVALLFTIDLMVAISSTNSSINLWPFWIAMVVVILINALFYFIELELSRKFKNTPVSHLDRLISTVVVLPVFLILEVIFVIIKFVIIKNTQVLELKKINIV